MTVAAASAAVEMTAAYVKEREVFGKRLSSFQNTKFVLAECAAEVEAGQALADQGWARPEACGRLGALRPA